MPTPLSLACRYPLHDALQHARQITVRRQNKMDWRLEGGIEVECVADSRRRWLDVKLPSAVQVF